MGLAIPGGGGPPRGHTITTSVSDPQPTAPPTSVGKDGILDGIVNGAMLGALTASVYERDERPAAAFVLVGMALLGGFVDYITDDRKPEPLDGYLKLAGNKETT